MKRQGRARRTIRRLLKLPLRLAVYLLISLALALPTSYALIAHSLHVALGETHLAHITISPQTEHARLYAVQVHNGPEVRSALSGSDWRLSMHVLLWDDWLLWMGFRPGVYFDHLAVTAIDDEKGTSASQMMAMTSIVPLGQSRYDALWQFLTRYDAWLPGVRSTYTLSLGRSNKASAEGQEVYRVVMKGNGPVLLSEEL